MSAAERGRAKGIRVVPKNPDPREFPFVPFACDAWPRPCHRCGAQMCEGRMNPQES